MKTLLIDTHLFDINVFLFDDFDIIKENHVIGEKYNSKYILNAIKKVCDDEDYDQIIVVNGPGSFTGVRLGVTIVKTLSYCLNKPIKAISYLKMMNVSSGDLLVSLSDGNGYFVGDYKNGENSFYLSNIEYKEFINNNNVTENCVIDYKKILLYLKEIPFINPHFVNPIYVKKISVEYDKTN